MHAIAAERRAEDVQSAVILLQALTHQAVRAFFIRNRRFMYLQ